MRITFSDRVLENSFTHMGTNIIDIKDPKEMSSDYFFFLIILILPSLLGVKIEQFLVFH